MGELTRRQKESRAYTLVLVTGGASLVTAALLVLAIFGVVGSGLPVLTAVIALVALLLLRRTVRG